MSGFRPRAHFASGQVAKCCRCERLAEGSWPPGWIMGHDGFTWPWCFVRGAPDLYCDADGQIHRRDEVEP